MVAAVLIQRLAVAGKQINFSMKAIKKYLLIALGLLLLYIFSSRNSEKGARSCCPFSMKPVNNVSGAVNE